MRRCFVPSSGSVTSLLGPSSAEFITNTAGRSCLPQSQTRADEVFGKDSPSLEWFFARAQAKVVIEAWRKHYNEVRGARLFDAGRVRREAQTDQRSSRFRNGPERWGRWGLRTHARCNTVLEGTIQAAGAACSLKLTVVPRIRAGQTTSKACVFHSSKIRSL
jgi:hypothetical protein